MIHEENIERILDKKGCERGQYECNVESSKIGNLFVTSPFSIKKSNNLDDGHPYIHIFLVENINSPHMPNAP